MISNLYGNPHSAHSASQHTSRRIEDARLRLLKLLNADPDDFDLVFVANATAGIKLVMDTFRDHKEGFWYGFHRDSHTSLVGVREVARAHRCFETDTDVDTWMDDLQKGDVCKSGLNLFAFPAQSNMNGRRLPLEWCRRLRSSTSSKVYSLLDAAGLVSTSPLDLRDASSAPDFIVMSLYKIFGFPDLGALIIRKSSGQILQKRRYFGGGTVEMVVSLREQWHEKKTESLHDQLEDGTLPVHSIVAVHHALDVHEELFGSLDHISDHCAYLSQRLYDGLTKFRHANGKLVCHIYKDPSSRYGDARTQGPVVAFNILNIQGGWMANSEIEKLASVQNICLRSGGLCNPGGIASSLQLAPWEMKRNFTAGQRCGSENDVLHGKPTGMLRVSLGAMSTKQDVDNFLEFVDEFFVTRSLPPNHIRTRIDDGHVGHYHVESLTIYPIKSCAGWKVPLRQPWPVHREGLAWDREWCLVRPGTGTALNQKRYPQMALLKPRIDLDQGLLHVTFSGPGASTDVKSISIPLSSDPALFANSADFAAKPARVCGDSIAAHIYQSEAITDFFTQSLGVDCMLARFPAVSYGIATSRHAKAHLQPHQVGQCQKTPGAFPSSDVMKNDMISPPILLSNESPILIISRSSLNHLNEQIKCSGAKAVHAEVFRANIVVAENPTSPPSSEQAYVEDSWRMIHVGRQFFQILGSCRRCQMVCINQETGVKSAEPFVTLARTRRFDGKVFFGQHACHVIGADLNSPIAQDPTISVGDAVQPYLTDFRIELDG